MGELTIIGISGKIASGKSTLAKAIQRAESDYERVSLADALKDELAKACKVSREHIETNKARYRPILQIYGTDIMRVEHGNDYWIRQLVEKAKGRGLTHIVVDDMRFPNELEGLRAAATTFVAVRLEVSPLDQAARCRKLFGQELSEEKKAHPSETALDGYTVFDLVVPPDAIVDPSVLADLALAFVGLKAGAIARR